MRLPVRAALALAVFASAGALAGSAAAQSVPVNPNPMDSIRRLPSYRPAADTAPLLPPARVEAILSFQAPDGGWSKHADFTKHVRQPGESYYAESTRWEWISTLDNDQTTEEMHFLARADRVRRDPRYEAAFLRGVPAARRRHAAAAVSNGTRCILDAQVVVGGRRTIWARQNDPLSFTPTSARSYELTSLSARESVPVVAWLMSIPHPDARVVAAVHDAAAWFRANAIHGYEYPNSDVGLRAGPGAGPIWARVSEIGTHRPIFANRDGWKLYDYSRLTDRRHGYGWFTDDPSRLLAQYERWANAHPRADH